MEHIHIGLSVDACLTKSYNAVLELSHLIESVHFPSSLEEPLAYPKGGLRYGAKASNGTHSNRSLT